MWVGLNGSWRNIVKIHPLTAIGKEQAAKFTVNWTKMRISNHLRTREMALLSGEKQINIGDESHFSYCKPAGPFPEVLCKAIEDGTVRCSTLIFNFFLFLIIFKKVVGKTFLTWFFWLPSATHNTAILRISFL